MQSLDFLHGADTLRRNALESRTVIEPGQWKWSSYRDYAGEGWGEVKLNGWTRAELKKTV